MSLDMGLPRLLVVGLPALWCLHFDTEAVEVVGGDEQDEVGDSGHHALELHAFGGGDVAESSVRDGEEELAVLRVLHAKPFHAGHLQAAFILLHTARWL